MATKKEIVNQKTAAEPVDVSDDEDLPEGFAEVSGGRVDGWFDMERGNKIQGTMLGTFEVKSKFGNGRKKVYKIQITEGETSVVDNEGVVSKFTTGSVVGLDECGWVKPLATVPEGREVYVKCLGKSPPTEEQPRGVWRFRLAALPA